MDTGSLGNVPDKQITYFGYELDRLNEPEVIHV